MPLTCTQVIEPTHRIQPLDAEVTVDPEEERMREAMAEAVGRRKLLQHLAT